MKKIIWPLLAVLMTLNMLFALDMPPKREFRGVWLSTVANIDWPKNKLDSDTKKQDDLKNYLIKLKDSGVNAVLMQVRCSCDAMYKSDIEPWSYWFSGTQGQGPSTEWDPLAFAVEEAHKLGLELHAWVNPYRAVVSPASYNNTGYISDSHVTKQHPDWILKFSDVWILNPGLPDVRDYITDVLMDIVNRYDIDGLHMDDYFYPYSGINNEDASAFSNYNDGYTDVHNWRRYNINSLVEMVMDSINTVKPWVKWGISPFGIWKPNVPQGILGMDAYNTLYCDPIAWLDQQTVDYITPQCYWPFGYNQDYGTLIPWWASQAKQRNRHFYPGQGLYRQGSWERGEIPRQIRLNRETDNCDGSVFFTANDFYDNPMNAIDSMKLDLYRYPALWPVMTWKDSTAPEPPSNAILTVNGDGSKSITWDSSPYTNDSDSSYAYVVYRSLYPMDVFENMSFAEDVQLNQEHSFQDDESGMFYYSITSLDRNKLESFPAEIEYPFVHPDYPEYADNTVPKDLSLLWKTRSGASQYTVELSETDDFASPLHQYTLSDTGKALALEYQSDYYWRVKSDNTTYWSPIWTFTTELPPQVQALTPMAYHEGVSLTPLMSWESFEDASTYELQVSKNKAMTDLVVDENSISANSLQVSELDYATYYYWRVRSNKYDRWTDASSFKTREEFIETLWERTSLAQRYPNFMDSTLEATGLAAGNYQDGSIVLVLQNLGDMVKVDALDPMNGDSLAFDLNMTDVAGGTHKLRDIELSEDGVIFAANCANIGETFKVYCWENEANVPSLVYEASNVAYRIGDHITVTGRHDDGSLKLYAPAAKSDKMLKLDWNSVSSEFEATQITLGRGNNSNPGMAVGPISGELYVSSNDYYLRHFTANGSNIAWMKYNANMPKNANSLASFAYNGKTYVAGYVKDTESAHIIDVSEGVVSALKAGATYRMGINENSQLLGDIEVIDHKDGTFTLYVLGDKNGLGAYTYDAASAMVDVADIDMPGSFELKQNFPNPFNPVTTIQYQLREDTDISISVFDLVGKHIITLFDGFQSAGDHELKFNASELPSGQYLYRLTAGDVSVTRKMVLLK